MKLSSLSKTELVDVLGQVNSEKKQMDAFEKRVKEQIKKKMNGSPKIYGEHFTVEFKEIPKKNFDKDEFVRVYGQKEYDSFCKEKIENRCNITPVEKPDKHAKDQTILSVSVPGYGEINAGRLDGM